MIRIPSQRLASLTNHGNAINLEANPPRTREACDHKFPGGHSAISDQGFTISDYVCTRCGKNFGEIHP